MTDGALLQSFGRRKVSSNRGTLWESSSNRAKQWHRQLNFLTVYSVCVEKYGIYRMGGFRSISRTAKHDCEFCWTTQNQWCRFVKTITVYGSGILKFFMRIRIRNRIPDPDPDPRKAIIISICWPGIRHFWQS